MEGNPSGIAKTTDSSHQGHLFAERNIRKSLYSIHFSRDNELEDVSCLMSYLACVPDPNSEKD